MNTKQRLLIQYLNQLAEPVPPTVGLEEGVFETATTSAVTPVTPQSVRNMLEQLASEPALEESAGEIEETVSPIPPPAAGRINEHTINVAVSAVEKAANEEPLEAEEEDILEAIVLPGKRPVLDITNGQMSTPPPDWKFLKDYTQIVQNCLPSIGRIDVPQMTTIPYGGTGFFVGDGLLLTNRHVARLFIQGVGKGKNYLSFLSDQSAVWDAQYEVGDPDPGSGANRYQVIEALFVHPHWDAALLRVKPIGNAPLPPPLKLSKGAPANLNGGALQHVVVIGYPTLDSRNDIPQQFEIFRNIFGRKRLMPGYLTGFKDVRTKWNSLLHAITHDASTLGGNSGSAVIDLTTGLVLALHFGGRYLDTNFSVPSWELAQDPNVNEFKLNFADYPGLVAPAATTQPIWLSSWNDVQPLTPVESPPPTIPAAPGAPTESVVLPVAPDWFERVSDTELVEAMRRDSERTKQLIRATLLPEEAEDLINDLNRGLAPVAEVTTEEGLFDFLSGGPKVDPSLPEIILLHGIMGGHLATYGGFGGRVWLSPLAFAAGQVATRLTLGDDGELDRNSSQVVYPDGPIRMVYEKPSRKWRLAGFVVHEFSFDWRKSISNSADRLHLFIESLRLERPSKKFVLVGHSMGGLVSALYAARHPEWSRAVTQAIFLGSPLRGSYAPLEAVMGEYPLIRKFALADRSDKLDAYMSMARTLPGLLDMLPDPAVFPDAEVLYSRSNWPAHLAPAQMWLDQSRQVKRLLATSPLLETAKLVVSIDHPTIAEVSFVNGQIVRGTPNRRGDGTVPSQSAAAGVPGLTIYRGTNSHGDLPREDAVIKAVIDLITKGSCDLTRLSQAEIDDPVVIDEAPTETIEEATAIALPIRLRSGIFTQRDVDFLLRPDDATLPGPVGPNPVTA